MRWTHLLIHLSVGTTLGAMAGVLLGWATSPHMQYLLAVVTVYWLLFGAVGGVLIGLTIGLLYYNPGLSLSQAVIIGSAGGLALSWPTLFPVWRIDGNPTQLVFGGSADYSWLLMVASGALAGVGVHTWNVAARLDSAFRQAVLENSRWPLYRYAITLAEKALVGGTIGAAFTLGLIVLHILGTSSAFDRTFAKVREFYNLIPIGSLLGAGIASVRLLIAKGNMPAPLGLTRGFVVGALASAIVSLAFVLATVSWLPSATAATFPIAVVGFTMAAVISFPILALVVMLFSLVVSSLSTELIKVTTGASLRN